ncbi:hypothetical protein EV182_006534, partial [Spiromyces aspiralis]
MSSEYDFGVVRGSLKIKKDKDVFKKKKGKKSKKLTKRELDNNGGSTVGSSNGDRGSPTISEASPSPSLTSKSEVGSKLTKAEEHHREVQRKRQLERIKKLAAKSHREKVQ